jgi:spermidine synthase
MFYRSYETARKGPVRRLHVAWVGNPRWSEFHFGMKHGEVKRPAYFDLTTLLLKWLIDARWSPSTRKVLEIGVGESAVLAGYFSRQHQIHVDAVELDAEVAEKAKHHVALNGVDVTVRQSDLFANLPEQRYDLIFWNLPYRRKPEKFLPGLFARAADYLTDDGELIIGYNSKPLPRASVLEFLEQAPGLELSTIKTWWWNMHEAAVIKRRR